MKVLGVYDQNCEIRCNNKSIFYVMKKFFDRLPSEYGECYFRNLEDLILIKIDDPHDIDERYNELGNSIIYSKNSSLGLELFRVSSYDRQKNISSIDRKIGIEQGLIEGMTEYLFTKEYEITKGLKNPFEVFCIKMLADIPNLFKPYFIPSHEEFIHLFPNKRNIYNLMYNLNIYHNCLKNKDIETDKIISAIKGVIDSLISIELSRRENNFCLSQYSEKFMDEITSKEVIDILGEIYPKYNNYASRRVNIKIRKRGDYSGKINC